MKNIHKLFIMFLLFSLIYSVSFVTAQENLTFESSTQTVPEINGKDLNHMKSSISEDILNSENNVTDISLSINAFKYSDADNNNCEDMSNKLSVSDLNINNEFNQNSSYCEAIIDLPDEIRGYVGDRMVIPIFVHDELGNPLEGDVLIIYNDFKSTANLTNGSAFAVLTLPDVNCSSFLIVKYGNFSNTSKINVFPLIFNIDMNETYNVSNDETLVFPVYITDVDGNPVNGTLTTPLYVSSSIYGLISFYKLGEWNVVNGNCNVSIPRYMYIRHLNVDLYFHAHRYYEGMFGRNLNVDLYSPDASKRFTIVLINSINSTNSTNDIMPSKNSTSDLVNFKKTSKIVAKKKTFRFSKKIKKYKITLKSGKNPIKNVKVALKIGKKTYFSFFYNYGNAIFKIKNFFKKGKFKSVITFRGNNIYIKSSKKIYLIFN